jgi:hypothetical protein
MNRQGNVTGQRLVFPFDLAIRKGVSESFINQFGTAVARLVPFTGGARRPNIRITPMVETVGESLVSTIVDYAKRASGSQT